MRWVIVLLVLNMAGFMAFDGVRALTVGDYVTPSSGEYAGQLGPWKHVVSAVGIAPRSTLMKCIFVAYGATGLALLVAFLRNGRGTRPALLAYLVSSLWYLPFGTLTALVAGGLLCTPSLRRAAGSGARGDSRA